MVVFQTPSGEGLSSKGKILFLSIELWYDSLYLRKLTPYVGTDFSSKPEMQLGYCHNMLVIPWIWENIVYDIPMISFPDYIFWPLVHITEWAIVRIISDSVGVEFFSVFLTSTYIGHRFYSWLRVYETREIYFSPILKRPNFHNAIYHISFKIILYTLDIKPPDVIYFRFLSRK